MSSYLDISERIKATDRDTGLHKEAGKKKLWKSKVVPGTDNKCNGKGITKRHGKSQG